ncbi:MAG: DUF86 domain-containing protein [Firmicutes bacterium]|nr:DUF86 domain-containing protein [Bacillota bacterium]
MEASLVKALNNMLRYTRKIIGFCENASYEQFQGDEMLIDACVMNFCNLGEQARRLPDEFKAMHQEIPWSAMYFMRNRLAHDYEGLNLEIVWQAIQTDLPRICEQLDNLLQEVRP